MKFQKFYRNSEKIMKNFKKNYQGKLNFKLEFIYVQTEFCNFKLRKEIEELSAKKPVSPIF